MPEYEPRVKFFVTTKADLATDKVNEWLEDNYDNISLINIKPFMSYTTIKDKGAYMIGCLIEYLPIVEADITSAPKFL